MRRRLVTTAVIDGEAAPVRSVRSVTDVDQPIASGGITLRAPRPLHVQPGVPVTVYAGYGDASNIIFSGRLADDEAHFDDSGGELRVDLEGPSKALSYQNHEDIGFTGPMSLNVWWRSMCHHFGIPASFADDTTDTTGDPLLLGNNVDIGAWMPISTTRTPLADMTRRARTYGYRHFDTPSGVVRLKRISGLPAETYEGLPLYQEGINVLSVSRANDLSQIANYIDVRGAKYKAADTSEVAIRSFSGTVTANPLLGPNGVNKLDIRDADIDTVALADAARNAHEIDYGGKHYRYRWTTVGGDASMQPGDVVAVQSAMVNGPESAGLVGTILQHTPRPLWVMRVEHTISDRGWITTMEGWAGLGSALPAGDDCVTHNLLGNTGVHIGNEYLWHYRTSNPKGTEHSIPFTVLDDYSTLTIRGYAHGCNSFLYNTESDASRFEIYQGGDRKASGVMPFLEERLSQRRRYDLYDSEWEPIVVPLTGSLEAGAAEFKIIAGLDRDVGDTDDYELRDIQLTTCGVGVPVIVE